METLLPIFHESRSQVRPESATQDEDEDDEPKALLQYDQDWDPKTEAGREKCLQWDLDNIIRVPSLRKQSTIKGGKSEHEAVWRPGASTKQPTGTSRLPAKGGRVPFG